MDELQLLERIRKQVPAAAGAVERTGLALGIGDDCAIWRQPGSREDLLFTTDMSIEDVHFRRETHSAEIVGHRAMARGLSDIAAMGGKPRFFLISLALAPWANARWVDGFYRGALNLAAQAGAALAGGDLGHAERVMCDVVVCGAVPRGKALRRDGARPGDRIYVSGSLGGSALGLETRAGAAWRKHARPEPRLALGRYLRAAVKASAAMDLSDGLSLDLHRLCLASGVAAELDGPLPVFGAATLEQALHGGEDYELLFTAGRGARVPAQFGGIPITPIGRIRKGAAGSVNYAGRPLAPRGYDHFLRLN
jgi:thiamine-monophosphate kinase